jgi:hypothetical protein
LTIRVGTTGGDMNMQEHHAEAELQREPQRMKVIAEGKELIAKKEATACALRPNEPVLWRGLEELEAILANTHRRLGINLTHLPERTNEAGCEAEAESLAMLRAMCRTVDDCIYLADLIDSCAAQMLRMAGIEIG